MIRIPILNYHSVSYAPAPWIAAYTVTPDDFERQLDAIVAGGRTAVSVSRLADASAGHRALPRDPVVITFDDGFADFADVAAPALAARGLPCTFYAATGSLEGGRRRESVFPPHPMVSWSQLHELEEQGVEIGAHSHTHRDLDLADPRIAADEVIRSKELLEDALGHEIRSFAYPYGHFTPRLRRVVAECGFDSACAVRGRLSRVGDDVFALARLPLLAGTTVQEVSAWVAGRGARVASARPDTLGIRTDQLYRRVLRMPVLPEDALAAPRQCRTGGHRPGPTAGTARRGTGIMDVSVYRPDELTTEDRTAWTALQSKAQPSGRPHMANPFLSPEFTLAVGRCKRAVRVAVVRENGPSGEPVAFFPYQRYPAGVGRAVGLGLSDCQGLVHRPGFQWHGGELLSACGLTLWEFDHLAPGQHLFEQSATGSFASPVIDVAEGWDAYLARLRAKSPNFTRTTFAKERRLRRHHTDVRYVHDERDPAVLRTLMEWKSQQYQRTGLADRFARPWITELVQQLFRTRSEPFAGILSVLYADGRPISAHFGLRTERVLSWWFPAYDPAYSRYSPGLILLMHLAEAAAGDGIAYLDLGRGDSRYKDSFKTGELSVSEGLASRRDPVALALEKSHARVRAMADAAFAHADLLERAHQLLKSAGTPRERSDAP